ncbi:XRE family transcriptional regulator [Streptomyces sp. NBC_00637]|uniref:helix-turn-helix domain-containing protein n=1 Tax=Streptomyces sp. NBC_00637 TaxID=2903667 RepID=UPI00325671F0
MRQPAPSPGGERLAAALRESRRRTGLSLAALAAKTAYSKSSWERYLNGRTLPPRPAVEELCRLAGEPDGRCLALWEIAKSENSGPKEPARPHRTAPPPLVPEPSPAPGPALAPAPPSEPAPEAFPPSGHRGVTAVAVLATVSALVFGAVVLTLLLLPHPDEGARPSASAPASATGPTCRDTACEGKDPAVTKCGAEPATLSEHLSSTGASIQLRYSRVCGTSWVRMWGARIGDGVELRGRVVRVRNRAEADTYIHTPMTATRPGTVVRACFLPAQAGGGQECFEARVD